MPDSQPPIKARANANKTLAVVGTREKTSRVQNWTASRLERTCNNLHTCTGHRLQLAQRTCMQTCTPRSTDKHGKHAGSDRTSKHPCRQTSPPTMDAVHSTLDSKRRCLAGFLGFGAAPEARTPNTEPSINVSSRSCTSDFPKSSDP